MSDMYDIFKDGEWCTRVDSLHAAIGYCEACNSNKAHNGAKFTYKLFSKKSRQMRLQGDARQLRLGEEPQPAERIDRGFRGTERIMALEWEGKL